MTPVMILVLGFVLVPILIITFSGVIEIINALKNVKKDAEDE